MTRGSGSCRHRRVLAMDAERLLQVHAVCSGRARTHARTHARTPLPCQLATNSEPWVDPGMERRAPLDRAISVVIIVSLFSSFTKALSLRLILSLCPSLVVVSSCHRRRWPGGRASNQSRLHCVVWSVVFVFFCGSGGPSWRRRASPDFGSPGADLISPSAHSGMWTVRVPTRHRRGLPHLTCQRTNRHRDWTLGSVLAR